MFDPMYMRFRYTRFFLSCLVAKSSYCDELSVAKSSNMLLDTKSWTVELSVAKDNVRRCIHITTASLATAGVRRYNL